MVVEVKLKHGEDGYKFVGEYIRRCWKRTYPQAVLVHLGISYDGEKFERLTEIACPVDDRGSDIEFEYDWWEGEPYITLYGMCPVDEIRIYGGVNDGERTRVAIRD